MDIIKWIINLHSFLVVQIFQNCSAIPVLLNRMNTLCLFLYPWYWMIKNETPKPNLQTVFSKYGKYRPIQYFKSLSIGWIMSVYSSAILQNYWIWWIQSFPDCCCEEKILPTGRITLGLSFTFMRKIRKLPIAMRSLQNFANWLPKNSQFLVL